MKLDKFLAEVKERTAAATKGPWCWNHSGQLGIPVTEGNFHFINNARTDIPRLLAMVERARERLNTLLNACEVCVGLNDTGSLRASAVKESITQVFAELDRIAASGGEK